MTAHPATRITLRGLEGTRDDMDALQRVLEAAPRYAERLTGAPPGAADAQSTYTVLPDGKSYDDKFVLGVFAGDTLVGCVDLIRGYPDPATAHIGLLLIAEAYEGRGIGRAAFAQVEAFVIGWRTCTQLRLGVLADHRRAHRFWTALGFLPTGERKPYRYGPIATDVVVYAKPLAATR